MEGGNVTPIDLEAGLDVKSSDMLVPFVRPTFQHNWQRYQGHCLPNSLRFEMNGWAAGWNVYNFDYENFRLKVDNYWFGCSKLNKLPTYMLNAYDSKDSLKAIGSIIFIPESSIINTNNCTATLSDNTITGVCNDKSFIITWDPVTESATINNAYLNLVCTRNKNRSWKLLIRDTTSAKNVTNTLYMPADLSGDGLLADVAYDKFENGLHNWGDYTYDGNVVSAPKATADITPTVSNNVIQFSYDAALSEVYSLNVSYDTFILGFDQCEVVATTEDQPQLINSKAGTLQDFNRYKGSISPTKLIAKDEKGIVITTGVPVWACVNFRPNGIDVRQAGFANNVGHSNVLLKAPAKFFSVTAKSVYDDTVVVTTVNTATTDSVKLNLNYRYNSILVSNTIEAAEGFNTQQHILNSEVWVFETRRYKNLRENITTVAKMLGRHYSVKNCTWKPKDYLAENKWANWNDKSNAVYTKADLNKCRSLRRRTDANGWVEGSDSDSYITNCISDAEKLKCIGTFLKNDATIYSEDQANFSYSNAYLSDGTYKGGTYERVNLVLKGTKDTFFPFEYVPKFNYVKFVKVVDDKGNEKIKSTIYKGCYYVSADETTIITDFNKFRALLLGEYSSSNLYEPGAIYVDNSYFNLKRIVKVYKTTFDFDYAAKNKDDASIKAWLEKWTKWYPNVQNPADLEAKDSDDTTYLNYQNIDRQYNVVPEITYTEPGIVLNTSDTEDYAYSAPEGNDTIIHSVGSNPTLHIWHNHLDATSNYDIVTKEDKAHIAITTYTTESVWVSYSNYGYSTPASGNGHYVDKRVEHVTKIEVPSYFEKTTTAKITHSTDLANETINAKLESGSISFWGSPKNDKVCWFSEIGLSYKDGKGSASAREMTTETYTIMGRQFTRDKLVKTWQTKISDDIDKVGKDAYFKSEDVGINTDGIIWAMPLWGYTNTRLKYTDIGQLSTLELNARKLFVFETVPNNEIKLSNKKIWLDRTDPTFKYSYNWYKLSKASLSPVEDDSGSIVLKLTSLGDAVTYYAEKQTVEDKDNNKTTEVTASLYYPPIAGLFGNLRSVRTNIRIKVQWKPDQVIIPISIMQSISTQDSINHVFYADGIAKLSKATADIGSIDDLNLTTYDLPVTLNICGKQIKCIYNAQQEEFIIPEIKLSIAKADLTFAATNAGDNIINIPIDILAHFTNISGRFAKDKNANLISYTDGKFKCTQGNTVYTFDYYNNIVLDSDEPVSVVGKNDSKNITFTSVVSGFINVVLKNTDKDNVHFKLNTTDIVVPITKFIAESNDAVTVISTDVRKPFDSNTIGKIDNSDEFQFIKQQWNTTVSTENFWWVNSDHILELTDTAFKLKRKTNELDDWNGDKFKLIYSLPRSNLLDSTIYRFGVTNVYYTDSNALLLLFCVIDDNTIGIRVYDIINQFKYISTLKLRLVHHVISEDTALNNKSLDSQYIYLNTYSILKSAQLLSQATWSNTIRDNKLFIGCHLSNNFDQWTAIFDTNLFKPVRCIQGYGFVGINGDLTGGMLPDIYCSIAIGFNSKVDSLETLKTSNSMSIDVDKDCYVQSYEDVASVKSKIVGTPEKQWYISKELSGIVASLSYIGGSTLFDKVVIPLTNNYSAVYDSPSVLLGSYGDLMVSVRAFKSMFNFEGKADTAWTALMVACGMPLLATFAPRKATLLYLQQTLGQYAYVHYNSSDNPPIKEPTSTVKDTYEMTEADVKPKLKSPLLSDDMTFDKQVFVQNEHIAQDATDFIMMLFALFAPAAQAWGSDLSINSTVALSTVKDTAKAYSQNVMDNLAGLAAAAIVNKGQGKASSSTIVGSKSLDMFYSTSDRQNVYAGPGFTEMQFVADCVAQSVTDIKAQGSVQQITFIIRSITVFQGKVTMLVQLAIAEGLRQAAAPTSELMVCGTNIGAAAAIAMRATATAIDKAQTVTKYAYEEIDKLLDILCSRGITSEFVTGFDRQEMQTEGKHKYGEKNETFMWPCWDIPVGSNEFTDESVHAAIKVSEWNCSLQAAITYTDETGLSQFVKPVVRTFNEHGLGSKEIKTNAFKSNFKKYYPDWNTKKNNLTWNLNGAVPLLQATCYGKTIQRTLPEDMACVQGVSNFLPKQSFKNENIGVSAPAFTPSMFQDYIIDKDWNISQCATYGKQQWVSCKDTKLINCPPSNMIISEEFCGIASSYTAIEVKRGLSKAYMRPVAITPTTLLLNCSGYNCIHDNKLYHACDGYSYRLIEWTGAPGLNKNNQTFWYAFQINDRFKRSNKFPANELQGNFVSEPSQAVASIDKIHNIINVAAKEKGMEAGTIGEDKDLTRWSIPIFTESVTTLPAAVKTLTAMPLVVIDGITGLVTDLSNSQSAYKAPLSVDFTIGKNVYRQTEEYICSVITQNGVDVTQDLVPSLGLTFIGSTPTEAFFYSKATRCYYSFTGTSLVKMDMMERFRDIQRGYWDFVNQEVIMPCLMTFKRLNAEVEDKDTETDNIIVPVMSRSQISGELPPPITTIFNDRSWYKAVSLPAGFAYQGPNRVIINRQVFVEYMLDSLKDNLGKWKKMDREKYVTKREYSEKYSDIITDVQGVKGWTYNPFLLVTSALGQSENDDCMFEWIITFCWPIEMDLIYGPDNYACVNIMAETMTPGGKLTCRPTHVFLKKELFTRTGNYGYYSFRFQSKNGAGNRERLHIWSDQYIAISGIDCDCKVVSSRRNEQIIQQLDVQKLKEL